MAASRIVRYVAVVAAAAFLALPVLAQDDTGESTLHVEATRRTNVRSGPSITYLVIARLEGGQIAPVTGRSDELSSWLRIDVNGDDGWVASSAVTVFGDPESVAIVQRDPPGSAATPSITLPEVTTNLDELPERDALETDVHATSYRVVNVRSGPGIDFPVLGVLSPGDTVDIIGTSGEDNEWLQIDYFGQAGWVAYFVVSVSGEVSALNIVDSSPAEALVEEESGIDLNQVVLITRFNSNLRAEPNPDSEILTVVPWQTTLAAEARTEDNRWLQVTYNDQTGWLIASLVNTGVSDVDSLPVVPVRASNSATTAST